MVVSSQPEEEQKLLDWHVEQLATLQLTHWGGLVVLMKVNPSKQLEQMLGAEQAEQLVLLQLMQVPLLLSSEKAGLHSPHTLELAQLLQLATVHVTQPSPLPVKLLLHVMHLVAV